MTGCAALSSTVTAVESHAAPLTCRTLSVRVKGGMSLRNGMWYGVWNGIIMRNTIYAGNKLTEERVLFSPQLYKRSSFFGAADSSRILNK